MKFNLFAIGFTVIGVTLAGCDGVQSPLPRPVEVKGRVTVRNAALSKGCVAFYPAHGNDGIENFVAVQPTGEFALRLVPGEYKVAIEPDWIRTATKPGSTSIPKKFWDANGSGLTVTVKAGTEDVLLQLN